MVRRNLYVNKPQILKALFNFSAIKVKGLLLVTKRIRQSREGVFPYQFFKFKLHSFRNNDPKFPKYRLFQC